MVQASGKPRVFIKNRARREGTATAVALHPSHAKDNVFYKLEYMI